jgi:hypothetical protein
MMTRTSFAALAACIAFAPGAFPLAAQHDDHSHAGERLGSVDFPVSCKPAARALFVRGMQELHSFWWDATAKTFQSVVTADSSCAMGYWGLALQAWANPFAGGPGGDVLAAAAAAAQRASSMRAPTARERGFIAAVAALYRDYATVPNARRLQAYSDTLARVYRDHPRDVEVAIYYALSLVATASPTDTTFVRQKQAAAILNPLFAAHPDHPGLAHYIIHANDSPRLASLGLDAAKRYAQIAPTAPHAQHMPSHIFIRLGLWDETVASNRKSVDAGLDYAKTQNNGAVTYHEFHALDYMVYGYLQQGRDSAARALLAEAAAWGAAPGPGPAVNNYNRTAIDIRLALERSAWAEAAALPVRDVATGSVAEALLRFGRGLGAARSGATGQAREEVAALERIAQGLAARNDAYWARIVGIKRQAVQAWVLLADGDTSGALREAKAAADVEDVTEKHPVTPGELLPARELEADMHFALGHFAAAAAAYHTALQRERGRARSMFGEARATELVGDAAAAKAKYADFLKLMEQADGTRPEIAVARAALATR